jgi:hypothetical protein
LRAERRWERAIRRNEWGEQRWRDRHRAYRYYDRSYHPDAYFGFRDRR